MYPSNLQHKLRSQHGGQKPPELCADLIKIFSKKSQLVFDPYAGVGGTLLGASISNREAIGIELNQKWIEIYKDVCKLENIKKQKLILGDSNKKIHTYSDQFGKVVIVIFNSDYVKDKEWRDYENMKKAVAKEGVILLEK